MSLYKSTLKNRFNEIANELLELTKRVYVKRVDDEKSENIFEKIKLLK